MNIFTRLSVDSIHNPWSRAVQVYRLLTLSPSISLSSDEDSSESLSVSSWKKKTRKFETVTSCRSYNIGTTAIFHIVTRTHYCGHIWTIIVFLGSISLSLLLFAQTCTVWSYRFHAFLDHYLIVHKNAVP